ncbi:MAG: STM3941 family protein [Pseudomonadota bacterium]
MDQQLRIEGSRKKAVSLLIGGIVLTAGCLWMTTEKPVLGWLGFIFFGFSVPMAVLMMLPDANYLRLDSEGFETVAMSRRHATRWSDVDGFCLASIEGNKMIGIVYSEQYKKQQAGRALASAMTGIEGAIPNHYMMGIDELLATLNHWHALYRHN